MPVFDHRVKMRKTLIRIFIQTKILLSKGFIKKGMIN